jgi:GNAT superfamily N-acetyltransferase
MEGSLDIRRATLADAAVVHELTRAAYAKWVGLIGREPLPMIADPVARVPDHIVDLLYVDGDLAGIVEMVPEDGVLLIENVAVAPAFQGRGFGRGLVAYAESLAKLLGLPRVRLYTNRLFTENIRLYIHLGYLVDREEQFGNGIVVHMSKRV